LREMDRFPEAGNAPPGAAEAMNRLRERVYAFKYGGGTIKQDDMNEIYEEIRKLYARHR